MVACAQNGVDTRIVQNIDPRMVKNDRFLGDFGATSPPDERCQSRFLEDGCVVGSNFFLFLKFTSLRLF